MSNRVGFCSFRLQTDRTSWVNRRGKIMNCELYLKSLSGSKGDVAYLRKGLKSGSISFQEEIKNDGTTALILKDGAEKWSLAQFYNSAPNFPANYYVTDWFVDGDHYFSSPAVETIRSIVDQWIEQKTTERETEKPFVVELILVKEVKINA